MLWEHRMEGGHKHGSSLGQMGDQLGKPHWLRAARLASQRPRGGWSRLSGFESWPFHLLAV